MLKAKATLQTKLLTNKLFPQPTAGKNKKLRLITNKTFPRPTAGKNKKKQSNLVVDLRIVHIRTLVGTF